MSFFDLRVSRKLVISLCGPALALMPVIIPAAMAQEPDDSLSRLESKLFLHDYPKDTQEQRLARLEKMVFGEAGTGDASQRIAKLAAAVPQTKPDDVGSAGSQANAGSTSESKEKAPASKPVPAPEPQIADSSSYPALTAMEQKVYGKSFANEGLEKRVSRMETKVFGKPGDGDISDRVDRLRQSTGMDIANNDPDLDARDLPPEGGPAPAAPPVKIPREPISDLPPSEEPTGDIQPFQHHEQPGDAAVLPAPQPGKHRHNQDMQPPIAQQDPDLRSQYGQPGSGVQEYGSRTATGMNWSAPSSIPAPAPDWRSTTGASGGGYGSYGHAGSSHAGYGNGPSSNRYRSDDLAFAPPVAPPIAYNRPSAPPLTVPRAPGAQNYSTGPQPAPSIELVKRLSAMEYKVYRQSYPFAPLEARVARLEATVFPGENTPISSSLEPRISRLNNALSGGYYSGQPTAQAGNYSGTYGRGRSMNY